MIEPGKCVAFVGLFLWGSMHRDYILLGLYCGLIFFLSHQPTLPVPMGFPNQDKLIHASAYAIMALFAWRAFGHQLNTRIALVWGTILFCSLYGVSDEFHQSFIQGRNADAWDWLADTAGTGFMVSILFWKRYQS